MGVPHIVAPGEHLSAIAERFGFRNVTTIWDHDQNAELRALRKSPNVLFPGDQVFIPDREQTTLERASGQVHRFELLRSSLELRVVAQGPDRTALAGEPFELSVDGKSFPLVTDDNGRLQHAIPRTTRDAVLTYKGTAAFPEAFPVDVGGLDPVETISGQNARLNNLGYDAGALDDADSPQRRSAIEEFQVDNGLTVDGKLGPLTQAKLLKVHGS